MKKLGKYNIITVAKCIFMKTSSQKGIFDLKKLISLILCFVFLIALVPFANEAEALLYKKGDLNGDNALNAKDAYQMALYLSGTGSEISSELGDLNFDETVNAKDYFIVKLHMAGIADIEKAPGFGGYRIAGGDIAGYSVVVTNADNPNMVFAAEELCKYVKMGDSSTLDIVYSADGEGKHIIFAEDESGNFGTDGFNIKTMDDGDLVITAGAKRGCMYAVYEILEEYFGFSFYAAGEFDLDLYSAKEIPADMDYTVNPTVRYRSITIESFGSSYVESTTVKRRISGATSISALQNAKYGYGVERLLANAHSFDVFLPMNEVFEATGYDDKRCLSQSALVDVCANNMIKLVETRVAAGARIGNEITEISCSYADGDVPCSCRLCTKVFNEEGKQHSGNLVRFVNKVYEKFSSVYPEITFVTNAYGLWHDAPEKTSLADGIVLLYCFNGCSNHLLGHEGCSEGGNYLGTTNVKTEADFLAWKEKCSEIYVWYYPTNIYYTLSPLLGVFNYYNDIRWFIENGATGFYVKGNTGCSFEDLDGYLISLLMWNPDMSEDEYYHKLKEYLRYHYGYGWEYIYEYMEMLRDSRDPDKCVLNNFELPFDMYIKSAIAENYPKAKELFAKAMQMADTGEQRKNIEKLSVHMQFLGLAATYYTDYELGDAESREAFADEWRVLYDYIQENRIKVAHDQVGIDNDFTLEQNPLVTVYPLVGSGER